MEKVVLDTDILSDIGKGLSEIVSARASTYLDEHGLLTFTSISVYEVLYGLRAKRASQQANRFLTLIGDHEEIVPQAADYRLAAEMRAAMHIAGTEIGKADPVIAACASRRGLVLATANTKHYRYIANAGFSLAIENWRDA